MENGAPIAIFIMPPFTIDRQKFKTSEHWIQFQKALLFNDSRTTNLILQPESPFKAKKLGYQINCFNMNRWKGKGYNLCFDGIKERFTQNPALGNRNPIKRFRCIKP